MAIDVQATAAPRSEGAGGNEAYRSGGGLLNPIDRYSEILFGLFMVLTFTGTLSAATDGREEVRTMLLAAIGCNAAWGLVDGVMYILRSLVARGRKATVVRGVRAAATPEDGRHLIADALGPFSDPMSTQQIEQMRQWILSLPPAAAEPPHLLASDFRAAAGVFALVFLSTFPVVLPFMLFDELQTALRVSAAIAVLMMFFCGFAWARYAGVNAWLSGLAMVMLGLVVESAVILLGG